MKLNVKFLQEGGTAPTPPPAPETGAPAPAEGGAPGQGGQDPLMQIAQMFAQGLQAQDCQALAQGAQMFLELISQAQGGGQGGPPPEEPTVMKKGGKFILKKKGDTTGTNPTPKDGKTEKPDMSKKGQKIAKKC